MATSKVNPFPTTGYMGREYFCDREEELSSLRKFVENGLISMRVSP